jgi:hypothetical protein
MISTSWTDAPAGLPAEGLVVRPRCVRRAPEAFTAPYQGTGLPFGTFGGSVVDTVAPTMQLPATGGIATGGIATDKFHNDATTLGIHSSRRPPG